MTQNETKFMDSAMALAETLHFTKAAKRLRISQPQLTKNIQELEDVLGFRLFDRDRKTVALNDAGRAYIEKAKLSIMYAERAFQAARDAMRGADTVLHIGRSPYTDPFLVTTLQSVQLPLYSRLKLEVSSQFSFQLVDEILNRLPRLSDRDTASGISPADHGEDCGIALLHRNVEKGQPCEFSFRNARITFAPLLDIV